MAADVSPTVRGVELSEALASDLILLAIPFLAVESLGRSRRDWSGKTIVDVTNAFMLPNADEVLAGRLSTEIVADAFPGAETVKAFNQLPINVLARDRSGERGKQVVFVSSNSAGASARVAELAERLGFSAIELGRLDEGGRLIQARNALVLRNLIELPMRIHSGVPQVEVFAPSGALLMITHEQTNFFSTSAFSAEYTHTTTSSSPSLTQGAVTCAFS